MQREIKFRAWDELLGMRPVMELDGEGQWWKVQYMNGDYTLSNGALMQFTGLKDANGVEIYEGDIAQSPFNKSHYVVKFGSYVWEEDGDEDVWHHGWYLDRVNSKLYEPMGNQEEVTECLIVVGNVYENPELLEGK